FLVCRDSLVYRRSSLLELQPMLEMGLRLPLPDHWIDGFHRKRRQLPEIRLIKVKQHLSAYGVHPLSSDLNRNLPAVRYNLQFRQRAFDIDELGFERIHGAPNDPGRNTLLAQFLEGFESNQIVKGE